jgi:hypothetical protein
LPTHPWVTGPISDEPFLLIAGAYRSGTTSLFTYLADHPQVRPAWFKEPGFFFSHMWGSDPPPFPPGREAEAYLSVFKRKRGAHLHMEGTPNYLFDPGCALRIASALPRSRIVVILREPVSRLISWYRHSLFQGRLAPGTDFEEWVQAQLDDTRPAEQIGYLEQSLRHGNYSSYVEEYLGVFGRDRVHITWFDALQSSPRETLADLSAFATIDAGFYDDYAFTPENESMQFRPGRTYHAYLRICRGLLRSVQWAPRLRFRLERHVWALEPRLLRAATEPAQPVQISPEFRSRLVDYYQNDLDALERVVGEPAPWAAAYNT